MEEFRFKTETCRRTLAPKWHEEFRLPILSWDLPNKLALEVADDGRLTKETLGCVLDFSSVFPLQQSLRIKLRLDTPDAILLICQAIIYRLIDFLYSFCSVEINGLRDGLRHGLWLSLPNAGGVRLHIAVTVFESFKREVVFRQESNDSTDGQKKEREPCWIRSPSPDATCWEPRKGMSNNDYDTVHSHII